MCLFNFAGNFALKLHMLQVVCFALQNSISAGEPNICLQMLQVKCFFFIWFSNVSLFANGLLHNSQTDFSSFFLILSVCFVSMWFFRLPSFLKLFPQILQLYRDTSIETLDSCTSTVLLMVFFKEAKFMLFSLIILSL